MQQQFPQNRANSRVISPISASLSSIFALSQTIKKRILPISAFFCSAFYAPLFGACATVATHNDLPSNAQATQATQVTQTTQATPSLRAPVETPLQESARIVVALTAGSAKVLKNRIVEAIPKMPAQLGRPVEIVLVIHGDAYPYVVSDAAQERVSQTQTSQAPQAPQVPQTVPTSAEITTIRSALAALAAQGVRIEVCSVGLERKGYTVADVEPFAIPVSSAISSLVNWQQRGFAYLSVQ